eukprot:4075742-Pyramimonas_sp.AAC.1
MANARSTWQPSSARRRCVTGQEANSSELASSCSAAMATRGAGVLGALKVSSRRATGPTWWCSRRRGSRMSARP